MVYLHDRCYQILDVGDGDCLIRLIDTQQFSQVMACANEQLQTGERLIYIAVPFWQSGIDITQISIEDSITLAKDLHLLIDIFWLDEVRIDIAPMPKTFANILQGQAEGRFVVEPRTTAA